MSKKLTATGLAVAAVAVVVYLGLNVGERQVSPGDAETALDETEKDRLASSAAISLIAAESEAIDAVAAPSGNDAVELANQTSAPPGFDPAPPTDHQATPPEGYSFTAYHEVARGPMTAEDFDREQAPEDPPAWMAFGDDAVAELAAASGRDWSFGWVKLAEEADLETLDALLAAHGGEVLGRAGDLVRARLPGDPSNLRAIAAAQSVAGLGAVPADRKITDTLNERLATNIHEEVPVWITLMSDDPDGQWRRALMQLGADVGGFDPSIRSYAATIPLTALGPISQADFVLAVESIGRVVPTLEIAAPAMGADALRSYDAATGTFVGTGGASVTVGVMDTGLNIDHPDISSNRRSICGANFTGGTALREEDQDLWLDFGHHGTHVAGIVLGNGAADANRVGMAPLIQDIRFAKAVSSYGTASALGWNRAMDWFATPTACGGDDVARKALVINSSLGVTSDIWAGRSVVERKIDASVWAARQLFVTSAGNSSSAASSSMAGAKNVLSVGAAQNIGDIAAFSSQGPTLDGRLMPKIVGTGVSVASARGRGARGGYNVYSGTSMSSPAVVGVAALVMDAIPELKEEPAALRARLMASAVKPDAFLGHAGAFPLDNTNGPGAINNVYGLGKVSARTAVLTRDAEDGWIGGTAAFDLDASGHVYQ
ncbi:MAG: S8 family serine peptidase, partial [Gammaproteobacteria bacterium]|nr:S8 family serine peptidase [Gammaproteobacteria bacterium]